MKLENNGKQTFNNIFYMLILIMGISIFLVGNLTRKINPMFFGILIPLLSTLIFVSFPYRKISSGKQRSYSNLKMIPYYFSFVFALIFGIADLLGLGVVKSLVIGIPLYLLVFLYYSSPFFLFFISLVLIVYFLKERFFSRDTLLSKYQMALLGGVSLVLVLLIQPESILPIYIFLLFLMFMATYFLAFIIRKYILRIWEPLPLHKPFIMSKHVFLGNLFFVVFVGGIFGLSTVMLFVREIIPNFPLYYLLTFSFLLFLTYPYDNHLSHYDNYEKEFVKKAQMNKKKYPFLFSAVPAFFFSWILAFSMSEGMPIINRLKNFLFSPGEGFEYVAKTTPGYKPGVQYINHYFVNEKTGETLAANGFMGILTDIFFYFLMFMAVYFLAAFIRKYFMKIGVPKPEVPRDNSKNNSRNSNKENYNKNYKEDYRENNKKNNKTKEIK